MAVVGNPRKAALEVQRAKILEALVQVVYRHGYGQASVSRVSRQAKVSHHTFCALFESLEDCFLAVLDHGAARARALIAAGFEHERPWPDGMRTALAETLLYFESNQALAHVLLVEGTAGGPRVRERREYHVADVTIMVERRWGTPDGGRSRRPLATAGVMASVLGVLHTHLVTAAPEPMISLLGPLVGLVLAPYLDPSVVAQEIEHGERFAAEVLTKRAHTVKEPPGERVEIPDALRDPRAHRARACLLFLAVHPGASNRTIAAGIGIARHTQISTLLARLAKMGLLVKRSDGPGRPNAWVLSSEGAAIARRLADERQHSGTV